MQSVLSLSHAVLVLFLPVVLHKMHASQPQRPLIMRGVSWFLSKLWQIQIHSKLIIPYLVAGVLRDTTAIPNTAAGSGRIPDNAD